MMQSSVMLFVCSAVLIHAVFAQPIKQQSAANLLQGGDKLALYIAEILDSTAHSLIRNLNKHHTSIGGKRRRRRRHIKPKGHRETQPFRYGK